MNIADRIRSRPGALALCFVTTGWAATFPTRNRPGPPLSGLVDLIGRNAVIALLAAMTIAWAWFVVAQAHTIAGTRTRWLIALVSFSWWLFVAIEFATTVGLSSPAWVNPATFALISLTIAAAEHDRLELIHQTVTALNGN